ncbi:hypothetical protein CYMTET_17503 [Cymbomonas tetramitiformis]|uniref:Costars domain-containing protein n=1 Tax=Cymbomonas tetramitiformis TaxID=36881 RepID=A0AAE0L794_9CHLO|nr:hypothetical protein CYMTET_17503 [Cymbomonas tetramitiformis]
MQQWVTEEIEKLLGVIQKVGTRQDDGSYLVTFGVMFTTYEDISDALVGIMMRAKKRGKIMYEGDMLFQRIHDDVKITMPAPAT